MTEYALRFMSELDFDREAIDFLGECMKKIYVCERSREQFEYCIAKYKENIDADYKDFLSRADVAAEAAGVHSYSARLLLFICLSEHLRELYRQRGIDDAVWYDSMLDLKWKLWECRAVKGIWGSFVAHWFPRFFDMTRFAFGRLQFELVEFKGDYEKNGKVLRAGDKVINVHIPRTLTPLSEESRKDAYAKAAEFFGDKTEGAPIAFVCSSWLLYPEAEKILPEHSNIRGFAKDYDVIRSKTNEADDLHDMWRLFDMDYTGDINDYPENSSLRRAYKKFLLDGNRTGSGYGVFFA